MKHREAPAVKPYQPEITMPMEQNRHENATEKRNFDGQKQGRFLRNRKNRLWRFSIQRGIVIVLFSLSFGLRT